MTILAGPAYITPTWRYAGDDWAGSNALGRRNWRRRFRDRAGALLTMKQFIALIGVVLDAVRPCADFIPAIPART